MNPSADQAREEAQEILRENRFHDSELPRPLHEPLAWLGDRLHSVMDALDAVLPGGGSVVWAVLSGLVLIAGLLVARRLVGMRSPGVVRERGAGGRSMQLDPADLERAADEAERAGDVERALRLRFRAGVLRLAARRVVETPSSVTTGALVRRLHSEPFARAARSFDEVVYGRRAATADDARLAREGWSEVLER
jgi:hypothetical protein